MNDHPRATIGNDLANGVAELTRRHGELLQSLRRFREGLEQASATNAASLPRLAFFSHPDRQEPWLRPHQPAMCCHRPPRRPPHPRASSMRQYRKSPVWGRRRRLQAGRPPLTSRCPRPKPPARQVVPVPRARLRSATTTTSRSSTTSWPVCPSHRRPKARSLPSTPTHGGLNSHSDLKRSLGLRLERLSGYAGTPTDQSATPTKPASTMLPTTPRRAASNQSRAPPRTGICHRC